ncbi:MAG: Inositol-1-monophosphatase [Promethearchaeota archaeon]|jgi:myo-inositol-1(or 4)-monophosphatase|nr:MAG: Inositol-1-monophosphatase [Candidatus Lokiarchaeota archaeon]
MASKEIDIEFLKGLSLEVYQKVFPLIGTKEGAQRLERGAGGDISMEIDLVAENTIIDYLEKNDINILLLSEETGKKYIGNKETIEKTQKKLIVDPVDGSTNCSRGIPFFSVSIAYAEGSTLEDIKMAVILDLITKDLYWAEKNKGTYLNDNQISVSDKGLSDQLIFEIDFYLWNLRKNLKKYRSILKKLYRIRVMGSIALSFCLLARGSVDGYIDFRRGTRLVDMAASYLIIREAGGKIFTVKGEPLDQSLSMELKFPLVACNAKLEEILKEELRNINSE